MRLTSHVSHLTNYSERRPCYGDHFVMSKAFTDVRSVRELIAELSEKLAAEVRQHGVPRPKLNTHSRDCADRTRQFS